MSEFNIQQKKQSRAKEIFLEIKNIITPQMSEKTAKELITNFLNSHPEVDRLWHPVVVKFDDSTANPLFGYTPSDEVLLNEIALVDVGFVIDGYEVDYAETWSINDNSEVKRLINGSKKVLDASMNEINNHSPASMYHRICELAKISGFEQIGITAGHKIGLFPTRKSPSKIKADNPDKKFDQGAWMIEIYISNGKHGAFFEDMVLIENTL